MRLLLLLTLITLAHCTLYPHTLLGNNIPTLKNSHHSVPKHTGLPRGVSELSGINASITNNHDLYPFIKLALKSNIFAIGESAHGVAGYQNLQYRLSKFLIEHFHYRIILSEILSDDRALNEYLLTGTGDLRTILYLNPWHGDDIEMVNFFEWVREWNVEHPRKSVQVFVVDPQSPWLNAPVIREFLHEYDPVLENQYATEIEQNCFGAKFANQVEWAYSPETSAYYSTGTLPQNETDNCFADLEDLRVILEDNKADIISSFDKRFYYDAVDAVRSLRAWVLKSVLLFTDTHDALTVREEAFAKTTEWKWKRSGSRRNPAKAIFLAHHLHISKEEILETSLGADDWTGFSPVGERLVESIGDRYGAVANSGYNVAAMFSGQYPTPTSEESIDFNLAAYGKSWLVLKPKVRWVRAERGGDWLVQEEGIPNGRYYNLPKAFDRVVFHFNASAGVFLNGN